MMQPAGGMVQPPMGMDQQHHQQQPQQWAAVMAPPPPPPQQQYYQAPSAAGAPPPPMWNQQPSMVPPPVVPQQMGPPPPQQQYQASAAAAVAAPLQPGSADEIRTLWIGDLQYWMDETFLWGCFGHSGEVVSVKIIRNRQTGQSEGYGFIEFVSRATAERVLQTYNGQMMPNIEQAFRLNWASCGAGEKRGGDDGADHTIFVGDLASDVTDYLLQETFKARYSSVKGAKVITDRLTGISKGYGFVRFGDLNEQARAMTEMNGVYCSSRPMRVGPAANKKNSVSQTASYQTTQGTESENDPNNTTIFVGGLDSSVTDDHLKQVFSSYGELVYVKIPVGKRCGFVQFANRSCAEEALKMLNGSQLGGQNIRLSWGRTPANKQPQQDPNQWNGSYYGYAQSYDTYSYAPPQDPNMYAYATYPGYGNYQQQPQQQQ
ncbi:polyadenylate-binding protein RBP45-like isoform X2 [Ananas comosus]|uniref:Polyadenylate-binding protein RBP45-like isoform X2 n=1 Tax=Ananas comosus TaxID=4615 RepID=A0A6P5EZK3_ANACO|nr:polyadenylate-binding protein RBP45-like isoform X2 [Ananas comosus]